MVGNHKFGEVSLIRVLFSHMENTIYGDSNKQLSTQNRFLWT